MLDAGEGPDTKEEAFWGYYQTPQAAARMWDRAMLNIGELKEKDLHFPNSREHVAQRDWLKSEYPSKIIFRVKAFQGIDINDK